MRHRGTESRGFRSCAKSTASELLPCSSPHARIPIFCVHFPQQSCDWPHRLRLPPISSNRPTLCPVPPMSKPTHSTSFSPNHLSQYELAQNPGSSFSPMHRAPTTISCPRCRPTRLLQPARAHQNAPRDSDSDRDRDKHQQLSNPKLHRRQQQHGRHLPQLLGHAADELMDVQLEPDDQDMHERGEMDELFPPPRLRQRLIRLLDNRECELYRAAARRPRNGRARILRRSKHLRRAHPAAQHTHLITLTTPPQPSTSTSARGPQPSTH